MPPAQGDLKDQNRAGGVPQGVKRLPSMCAALGLIPSSEKQKQKNRD
jgi:hypothetical protein